MELLASDDLVSPNPNLDPGVSGFPMHLVFDVAPDLIAVVSRKGILTSLNPAFDRLTRFSRVDWLGRPLQDLVHPDDFNKLRQSFERTSSEQKGRASEMRLRVADGTYISLEGCEEPLIENGVAVGVLVIQKDVTERRNTERALRDTDERLNLALESAEVGIWDWDIQGRVLTGDRHIHALLGHREWDGGQALDGFIDCVASDDRVRVRHEAMEAVRHGGQFQNEFRVVWPCGQIRHLASRGKIYRDESGAPQRMIGISWDITEIKLAEARLKNLNETLEQRVAERSRAAEERAQKLAESELALFEKTRALEESHRKVSTVLSSITDMHFSVDRQWRIQDFNTKAEIAFGKRLDEIVGRVFWDTFPEGVGSEFHAAYHRALEQNIPQHIEAQSWILRKWYEAHAYPTDDGLTVYFRDISERKNFEEIIQKTSAELARSNEDLERFAYIASHDLQEPLRMVTSYLMLLERHLGVSLDSESKEFIHFAVDGAKRMKRLIDDLLNYAHVGGAGALLKNVPVRKVIDEALYNLSVPIAESGAEILVESLPHTEVVPIQFVQVFQNLIGNALKFRSSAAPVVRIKSERRPNDWLIRIADNGIGMDMQFADHIFDFFGRLHPRTDFSGTGLGLAVCKKMIERHSGRIWVESEPGVGSTFNFTIPRSKPCSMNQ